MLYLNKLRHQLKIDETQYRKIILALLKHMKLEKKHLSVTWCDNTYIKKLNTRFRNESKATDVLSFPMDDVEILGDIVISLPKAKENAQEFGNTLFAEVVYLSIHGLCHLLGYDHGTKKEIAEMQQAENKLLSLLIKYKIKVAGRI